MNEKSEQKKQLIILSIILIFVIILAVLLNTRDQEKDSIRVQNTNNIMQEQQTGEQKILDNLKGLLEEPNSDEEEYQQYEIEGTEEKTVTTQNGETIIIKE